VDTTCEYTLEDCKLAISLTHRTLSKHTGLGAKVSPTSESFKNVHNES